MLCVSDACCFNRSTFVAVTLFPDGNVVSRVLPKNFKVDAAAAAATYQHSAAEAFLPVSVVVELDNGATKDLTWKLVSTWNVTFDVDGTLIQIPPAVPAGRGTTLNLPLTEELRQRLGGHSLTCRCC